MTYHRWLAVTLLVASRAQPQAGVIRHEASDAPSADRVIQLQQRPRGRPFTIAGQVIGGTLGAAALGMMLFNSFDDPLGYSRRVKGDEGYTPNANTAYALGSFVGAVA